MKPISLISYSTFPPSGPSALHVCPHCGNVRFPPFPTHSHQENIKCSYVYINFLKFSWCAAAYNDTCTLRVGPPTDLTPIYTCSLIKKFLVLLPWDGSHGLRCCVRHEFYEIVFPADAGRHNSENRHKAFLMKIITFRTPKATPNPPDMNWPLGPHPLKKCC